ncbi:MULTISPECIES: HNH endonuclease [Methylorubrum]|nr:HNH endonuclease [Methylorubrum sp. DB1722]
MLFIRDALSKAIKCPLCSGLIDPLKSMSYDHIQRVKDGGGGDLENVQMVHHYCNSIKN